MPPKAVERYPDPRPGKPLRLRIEFDSEAEALAHRRNTRCGGWVLGRFLYPGVAWKPSEVMKDCPEDGELR